MDMQKRTSETLRERSLLIVDDNPADRVLYRTLLEEVDPGTDYRIAESETARGALDAISRNRFDCILIDYLLPDMLGLELLPLLRQQAGGAAPIVMLTGFGDEATAVNAIKGGAQGYVPKRDLDGRTLLQAMDQAIRGWAQSHQVERARAEMDARNKDLEARMKQVQGMYRGVLGKIDTPVCALRDGLLSLARDLGGLSPSQAAPRLTRLCAESERLTALVRNLGDHPEATVSEMLISSRPEPLMEIISEVSAAARNAADVAGVRLAVRVQPGLPEVPVDRYRITQALFNLLDELIQRATRGQVVSVAVERCADKPRFVSIGVRVSDPAPAAGMNGNGAAPPKRCVGNGAVAGEEPLSLKVCQEIVRLHGGEFHAAQASSGRVEIRLPLGQADPMGVIRPVSNGRDMDSAWRLGA